MKKVTDALREFVQVTRQNGGVLRAIVVNENLANIINAENPIESDINFTEKNLKHSFAEVEIRVEKWVLSSNKK